jgi:hypothetical protein
VSRFFTFQVFATFIYQFVVGSALGRIQELIKDPTGQIINILGVSGTDVKLLHVLHHAQRESGQQGRSPGFWRQAGWLPCS